MDDQFEKTVFVLTSNTFQKWYLAQGDPERLVYSCDIETLARKAFALNTWVSPANAIPELTPTATSSQIILDCGGSKF